MAESNTVRVRDPCQSLFYTVPCGYAHQPNGSADPLERRFICRSAGAGIQRQETPPTMQLEFPPGTPDLTL